MATTLKVPYVNLVEQHALLKTELLAAVTRVIDSAQFILGPEVLAFERAFAELSGVRFAIGVANGTDALVLALRALKIGPGDEVITAPNSFVASASCIILAGATPVFADVREDYNIDPEQIECRITARTRAIIPVHLTGRVADMDPILAIAKKHNLHVIEDAAQAVRAEYRGKRSGSFGTIGCFSLHPLKNLNALGDAGVLTTNVESLYHQLLINRNLGLKTRDDCVEFCGNSRLDTIQAAMLLVKLKYLDAWTNRRRENAAFYQRSLEGLKNVVVPADKPHERAVYHTFVIQAEQRDALKKYLAERGVDTAIHYPVPIHLHRAAAELGQSKGSFPVSEHQADRILSLPVYPGLSRTQMEHVVECITDFYKGV